jgi:hypothetical protein
LGSVNRSIRKLIAACVGGAEADAVADADVDADGVVAGGF